MRNLCYGICVFALNFWICFASEEDVTYDNKPCKGIDEKLLQTRLYIEPIEHSWVARLVLKNGEQETTYEFDSKSNRSCLGALITEKHVLAPARCVQHHYLNHEAVSVELGVWKQYSKTLGEWDCNDEGWCVPPVERNILSDIAVHPEYDSVTSVNNIAILTLSTPVDISQFVKPVCRRPDSLADAPILGENLYLGGFHPGKTIKNKASVDVITQAQCTSANPVGITVFTSSVFCGIAEFDLWYDVGSSLVGVNVINNEPSGFYLVGLLNQVGEADGIIYLSFQDVRPFKEWIQRNIGAIEF